MSRWAPVLLMSWVAACGGTEAPLPEEPELWTNKIQSLTPEPGCYFAPPPVEIPEDASDGIIAQAHKFEAQRNMRAFACFDRIGRMVRAMESTPDAGRWELRYEAPDETLSIKIESDDPRRSSGEFSIDVTRVPNRSLFGLASADGDREACFQTVGDRVKLLGHHNDERTVIDQGTFMTFWNEEAVVMLERSPIGPLGIYFRGCDPQTDISYGLVVSYDVNRGTACWTRQGKFVPCDGVDTWPFEF